jgi:hypothetical protein
MLRRVCVFMMLIMVWLAAGCGDKDESLTVAKHFWKAMEDRDLETAKSYATRATANSLNMEENGEDQDVEIIFGEVTREEGKILVATTMRTSQDEKTISIPMKTVLVKEDGRLKVDVDETMMSLFGGAMGAMMESMKEGFQEMGKAMADGMKAGFEGATEKQSVDEDED